MMCRTKRATQTHRAGWLWLASGCGLAFVGVTLPILLHRNWPGEWIVVQWALGTRSPWWTGVMQAITFLGSAAVGAGLSVGCSAALFLGRRRLDRLVWLPLVAMWGSAPVNFALRAVIGRLRPGVDHIPHFMPEITHPFQRWSYPSGHAMTATICYGFLVYLAARAFPKLRVWSLGALALWLLILGFSRVYLGVHWPTDVVGGCLIGGCWLALVLAWLGD